MPRSLKPVGDTDALLAAERRKSESLARLANHLLTLREAERGALARELHDELGGLFTAAKLDATRIKLRLQSPEPEVVERLEHLMGLLNLGVKFKRRIIEELMPSALQHLGLATALQFLVDDHLRQIDIALEHDLQAVELSPELQLTAYRLVQEALANIRRHSGATWMRVAMSVEGARVQVHIEDDGTGFDPSADVQDGFGLQMLRHRIEGQGGELTVESTPGQGTRVSASLPAVAGTAEGAPAVGV